MPWRIVRIPNTDVIKICSVGTVFDSNVLMVGRHIMRHIVTYHDWFAIALTEVVFLRCRQLRMFYKCSFLCRSNTSIYLPLSLNEKHLQLSVHSSRNINSSFLNTLVSVTQYMKISHITPCTGVFRKLRLVDLENCLLAIYRRRDGRRIMNYTLQHTHVF